MKNDEFKKQVKTFEKTCKENLNDKDFNIVISAFLPLLKALLSERSKSIERINEEIEDIPF